jgi:hypothetical protein
MIEDRSRLKHSVHKLCVPNLHIAQFRKAQDDGNPTVRRIFCLAPNLRYYSRSRFCARSAAMQRLLLELEQPLLIFPSQRQRDAVIHQHL